MNKKTTKEKNLKERIRIHLCKIAEEPAIILAVAGRFPQKLISPRTVPGLSIVATVTFSPLQFE